MKSSSYFFVLQKIFLGVTARYENMTFDIYQCQELD